MYYEINVAVFVPDGGKGYYDHLFATAERSLTTELKAKQLFNLLKEKFPEPQYIVEVSRWEKIGHGVKF